MRLAVLISGNGSNLQALIDAIEAQTLDAQIVLVVSNRREAYGLVRARQHGLETLYFPIKPYRERGQSREAYDADLAARVRAHAPDVVVLAGWMHILSPAFLDVFAGRVINLHPALPNAFNGVNAIERAWQAYQAGEIDHSGVMVHYAIPEVDAGAVIVQERVPFLPDDTFEQFATRIHATEHRLIVEAVRRLAVVLKS